MTDSSSERDPVEALAEEFLSRHRRGENPALTEYTTRYPQWADEIRDLFPALILMEKNRPRRDEGTGDFAGTGDGDDSRWSGSAIIAFCAKSAGAAWGSSTRRSRNRWAGTSPLRSCPFIA
jgi:hypothetical protein